MKRLEAGFSTILIVLMTAVVLIGVLTTSVSLTLSRRLSTSNERASYNALLASESGHETFRARAAATPFAFGRPACSMLPGSCSVSAHTTGLGTYLAGLGPVTVPGGRATLTVSSVTVNSLGDMTSVDLLSTGTIGQDRARTVRSYTTGRSNLQFPHIPGAVTSYPGVSLGGNATVSGLALGNTSNTGTIPNYLTVQSTASTPLAPGSTVALGVPAPYSTQLSQLQPGYYVQLPTTLISGVAGPDATFKVTGTAGGQLTLQAVLVPVAGSSLASGSLPLTNVLNGIASTLGTQLLNVSATETFYPGDQISVTFAGMSYTSTVTAVNGSAITTSGWPVGTPVVFPEGTAIIKSTNAVVTAGTFSGNKQPAASVAGAVVSDTPGSVLLAPPTGDALFQQIMNMTPAALKALATVIDPNAFTGTVSGLTWLNTVGGSINLNSTKLNGSGVFIVDGDLNINNNGGGVCDYSGILFVRGNLSMHGNIQICGALVVEGAILSSSGVNAIGINPAGTDVGGTGQKVQYSPTAILDAIGGAGPYTFSAVPFWRQQ